MGGGEGGAKSYNSKKTWSSLNQAILSVLTTALDHIFDIGSDSGKHKSHIISFYFRYVIGELYRESDNLNMISPA